MRQLIAAALITGLLALPQAGSAAETYDGTPPVELGLAVCTPAIAAGQTDAPMDCEIQYLLWWAAEAAFDASKYAVLVSIMTPGVGDDIAAAAAAATAYAAAVATGISFRKCLFAGPLR